MGFFYSFNTLTHYYFQSTALTDALVLLCSKKLNWNIRPHLSIYCVGIKSILKLSADVHRQIPKQFIYLSVYLLWKYVETLYDDRWEYIGTFRIFEEHFYFENLNLQFCNTTFSHKTTEIHLRGKKEWNAQTTGIVLLSDARISMVFIQFNAQNEFNWNWNGNWNWQI